MAREQALLGKKGNNSIRSIFKEEPNLRSQTLRRSHEPLQTQGAT
jgi:hypothetical protein